jgi:hypothetical protein
MWHHRVAVVLRTWAVNRESQHTGGDGSWRLSAMVERTDHFVVLQRPLRFAAARPGGFWYWPVLEIQLRGDGTLHARLGPPE